jgi:hypothetical protein
MVSRDQRLTGTARAIISNSVPGLRNSQPHVRALIVLSDKFSYVGELVLPRQPVPYRQRGSIPFRWLGDEDITTLHGLSHDAAADRHAMIWPRISSYPPV